MPLGVAGIAGALLVTRRVRPAALLVAGLIIGMSPGGDSQRRRLTPVVVRVLARRAELLHRQQRDRDRLLPSSCPASRRASPDRQRTRGAWPSRRSGRPLTDAEASDYFFGLAWTWIRQHPGDAPCLFVRKLGYVFNAQHVALPHSYPFYAYDAHTMLRFYVIGPWLLVPLGLVGLVIATPRLTRADYYVWLAFVPSYAISVAAFFIAERYRLPLLVPLCIGAGAAMDVAWRAVENTAAQHAARPRRRVPRDLRPGQLAARTARRPMGRRPPHGGAAGVIGRYDEAEQWVQKLEPDAPRRGIVDYTVGVAYLSKNETARAMAHLTKAEQVDPGRPNVEYALGQALLRDDKPQQAVPYLRRGFDGGANVPLPGYDLAVALEKTGDLAAAADVIRRITLPEDTDPEVWLRFGRLASEVKAPDAAEPFFAQAVRMRPDQASARQQYGLNLTVLNRFDEGARELNEAVRLDPKDADSLAYLAYCEVKLGQTDAARAHVRAALAIKPDHPLANQLAAAIR